MLTEEKVRANVLNLYQQATQQLGGDSQVLNPEMDITEDLGFRTINKRSMLSSLNHFIESNDGEKLLSDELIACNTIEEVADLVWQKLKKD